MRGNEEEDDGEKKKKEEGENELVRQHLRTLRRMCLAALP